MMDDESNNLELGSTDRPKSGSGVDSINPFKIRPGHFLSWDNVDMKVSRKKNDTLHILRGVSGQTKPSELTGIMGESGSGKTSLLEILAGRLTSNSTRRTDIKGSICMDGKRIDPTSVAFQRRIAYAEQRETLFSTTTPREAIYFAARLRLSRTICDEDIALLTDSILEELNLTDVANSLIGGDHLRGLSGGEKRRVALGIQLVVCPNVLLLDEVTSGIDSKNAASVVLSCKKVAESGAAVIMVIHQPSSDIFSMMDKVIILEQGRCMYHGNTSDVPEFFQRCGYPIPTHYNPADWIIKVTEAKEAELEMAGFFSGPIEGLEDIPSSGSTLSTRSSSRFQRVSFLKETAEQVRRDNRNLLRDRMGFLIRFGTLTAGAALIAIAYAGVGSGSMDNPLSFSSHVGAIFLVLISSLIILQLTIVDFSVVREMYVKELKTDHYRIASRELQLLSFATSFVTIVRSLIAPDFLPIALVGLTKIAFDAWSTFVQCLVVMLVVYWIRDLNGRFWYLLLVLYAVTMANLSSAIAVGCMTPVSELYAVLESDPDSLVALTFAIYPITFGRIRGMPRSFCQC